MGNLQNDLDALTMERQWVITQARKGKISEDDMDFQLSALSVQELGLKQRMNRQIEVNNLATLTYREDITREHLSDLATGLEWQNAAPQNDEERHQKYLLKR